MFLFRSCLALLLLLSCSGKSVKGRKVLSALYPNITTISGRAAINDTGTTIVSRFRPPDGYARIATYSSSFCHYLRHLPLKPAGTPVKLFDGREKESRNIYCAVLDLPIGDKDLHQCADAVMRLRAEYLFVQKRYDEIHFNYTNGFRCNYSEWRKGKRVSVYGNHVSWIQTAQPSDSYDSFWKYLESVFAYAGSLSLSKELKSVKVGDVQPGDVFIRGGSPGHAVIVVDVAENSTNGNKVFMIAQSYMPAQETQVLINPNDEKLSPWYPAAFGETLYTPEWTFSSNELKRFAD